MKEEFNKVGDYILRHDVKQHEGNIDGVRKYNSYTRMFNFFSREVITTHRDWLFEGRGSSAAGHSAIATHVVTESFDDLSSDAEAKHMHAKLLELGGKPPKLADVLPGVLGKKPGGLRPPSQPGA